MSVELTEVLLCLLILKIILPTVSLTPATVEEILKGKIRKVMKFKNEQKETKREGEGRGNKR